MVKKKLFTTIKQLLTILKMNRVRVGITGGLAVSVYGIPRATYDIDGVILIERTKLNDLLKTLKQKGFSYPKKLINTIQGMPFLTLQYKKGNIFIDLFLAKDEFQLEVLKRVKLIQYHKIKIPIVTVEDLILIKLQAGRPRDIDDIRGIIITNQLKLDLIYLKFWAKKIGVESAFNDEWESLGLDKNKGR